MKKTNAKKIKKSFDTEYQNFKLRPFSEQCFLAGIVHYGIEPAQKYVLVAEYLGISDRTVRRYYDDEQLPTEPVSRLLFVQYCGFAQGCGWSGWKMRNGLLISPTNESVAPDLIGRLWLWRNERNATLGKVKRLEKENERLKKLISPETMDHISNAAAILNNVLTMKAAS
ncbi:hypothetical protein [Neptunicella sp. SCSIO 80796]|uniref:hypothetical protein n=1 Tax=Neptunicella plasticusilytica TaxID=3117012 RepID=UPI003A4E49E1